MKKVRILITLLLGLAAGYWVQPEALSAQTVNHAALVVRAGDQQVQSACVEFTEPEISGLDLLLRSNLDVAIEAQGMGALVCSIGGTGCAASDCWCQCKGGGDCVYWSYWRQNSGAWQYSQIGSTMVQVTNGTVEGWSWGPGSVSAAIAPPAMTFDDVCNPASAAPITPGAAIVVTIPPTTAPVTSAAATITLPAVTATPTATLAPTATALATATPVQAAARVTPALEVATEIPTETAALPELDIAATARPEFLPAVEEPLPTSTPRTRSIPAPAEQPEESVEIAAVPAAEATTVAPARVEPDRAKIAAATVPPNPQALAVIGEGVVLQQAAPAAEQLTTAKAAPLDWLSYAVFVILVGFLAFYSLYNIFRTREA